MFKMKIEHIVRRRGIKSRLTASVLAVPGSFRDALLDREVEAVAGVERGPATSGL